MIPILKELEMYDAMIFNLTLCIFGVLLILAMWIGLWAYFDWMDLDTEEDGEMKCDQVERK